MLKKLLLFFVMALFFGMATALPAKKVVKPVVHLQVKVDSAKITPHQFDTAAITKYRSDPEFKYIQQKTGVSLWDRFWDWVWSIWQAFWDWVASIFEKLFGNVSMGKHAASVFKFVILGVAAFLVVYVIFKLLGVDMLKIFRKKKSVVEVPYTESLENIHEINFDEAIENALAIKNYRLAVRLLYLRSLKQLTDNNLITWKLEKTNSAYLNELADPDLREQFLAVTRQFEFVWYGDFPVNTQSFQNINAIFQDFKTRLS